MIGQRCLGMKDAAWKQSIHLLRRRLQVRALGSDLKGLQLGKKVSVESPSRVQKNGVSSFFPDSPDGKKDGALQI